MVMVVVMIAITVAAGPEVPFFAQVAIAGEYLPLVGPAGFKPS
jgi:hypothetical protein